MISPRMDLVLYIRKIYCN